MIKQSVSCLERADISYLERLLLDDGGFLRVVPFVAIRNAPQNDISLFCHKHAVYQIVTTELVEFVGEQIAGFSVIEIGAGNGCLGRELNIPLTDNRMQEREDIKLIYRQMRQPVIRYPDDVRKLDALTAIKVLKADAAVGSWVTHKWKPNLADGNAFGVDEAILSKRLKRYVFVGNEITHRHKELLRYSKPKAFKFDWLVSRSMQRRANVIWIFDF
jgi:hypothetical protein